MTTTERVRPSWPTFGPTSRDLAAIAGDVASWGVTLVLVGAYLAVMLQGVGLHV